MRVATLNRIVEYSDKNERRERNIALQTLKQINKLNSRFSKQFEATVKEVTEALKQEHIVLVNEKELNDAQRQYIRDTYYQNRLCGHITPIWMSAIKQFGEQADDTIYLAMRLTQWEEQKKRPKRNYAVIELPVGELGLFVQLPDEEGNSYLMYLDDVVRSCLPYIFRGMEYNQFEAFSFKFTKDAEMEMDTDLRNGLMQKISKGVKSRKRGEPIRLTGIIDRYLEHSRILIFANGGEEKIYIGSADWMPRNLDHRIEVLMPVYDPAIQADLRRVAEYGLKDTRQGRIVDGSGENHPLPAADGEPLFRSQEALYQDYLTQETQTEQ